MFFKEFQMFLLLIQTVLDYFMSHARITAKKKDFVLNVYNNLTNST